METTYIKISIETFDKEFCSNGVYGTSRSACKFLGTKERENECRLFSQILDYKHDTPKRCNDCTYSQIDKHLKQT